MTKTLLITGAARGIGLATAKRFLKEGWQVAVVDIDATELKIAEKQLPKALIIHGDVSDRFQVTDFINRIKIEFGRLDALVNNAGVADFGPIEETTFERWRRVMATNLDGVFLVSQAALPLLKQHSDGDGGAIVNIASISGLRGSTLRVAYGTSKAAVNQLTLQQAAELGEYKIRCNSIAPGPVRTKLAMAVHSQEIIDAYHDALPLNRYGSEDEIANAIWFLCSTEASYMTGQLISVDGGFQGMGIGLPALRSKS
jgi:meso-butanediol dehydrogenase/(S,S)-butanediol dehydrogenase/diacetyl reductase